MPADPARAAPLAGRWTLALIVVAGAAALGLARSSPPAFIVAASVALVATGYAAYFWPRATLVGVAITTLLDPAVAVRMLPPGIGDGPVGISEPLLLVAGVVSLTRASRPGLVAAVRDPTVLLLAAFVGVSVLSALVNAVPPTVAVLGIVMTVDAVAIYVLWRALEPPESVAPRAVAAIVAAVLVVALFGIGQVVLAPSLLGFDRVASRPGDVGQITSFVGNPNVLAAVLGIVLPFPIYGVLRLDSRRDRLLALAGSLVLLVALVLTGSRGAWIAVAAGMIVGGALVDWRGLVVAAGLTVVAAAIAASVPVHLVATGGVVDPAPEQPGASASPAPAPTPSAEPTAPPPPDPLAGMSSEEIRILFLRDGLRVAGENPFLGVGPGRYGGAAATIFPSPVYEEYGTTLGRFRTIHNFWLHLAAEVGVVGVTLVLGAVTALVLRFRRAARRADGAIFVVLAGAATSALVVIFNSATEMLLEGNIPAVLIWLILGIGAALAPDPRLGIWPRGSEGGG